MKVIPTMKQRLHTTPNKDSHLHSGGSGSRIVCDGDRRAHCSGGSIWLQQGRAGTTISARVGGFEALSERCELVLDVNKLSKRRRLL